MGIDAIAVGQNPELLRLRAAVLGAAGVDVTQCIGWAEFDQCLNTRTWDVLLICHSAGDCQPQVDEFRRTHPYCKIVVIASLDGHLGACGDIQVLGIDGAAALIRAVLMPVDTDSLDS